MHSNNIFFHVGIPTRCPGPPHYRGFTITLRHATFDRTPLDEWSVRRRGLCLTTHDAHKRQTSMPLAIFEATIPASERTPPTHNLDRAVFGTLRLLGNLKSFPDPSLHVVFSTTHNFLFGAVHPIKTRTKKSLTTFDIIRAYTTLTHSTSCNYLLVPIPVPASVRK
jgi:hypothetical protein